MSNKKRQILDTAMVLFRDEGFQAVGVDRIIAEAGVAKTTLYKYFPSKNQLIAEVLRERNRNIETALTSVLAASDGKNTREKLYAVFAWHRDWFADPHFHGCLFMNATAEFSDKDEEIRQVVIFYRTWLREWVQNILPSSLSDNDARRLAIQVTQILDGAIVAAQAGQTDSIDIAWCSTEKLLETSEKPHITQ